MLLKQKSLTLRAAEAVKKGSSSADLKGIKQEVTKRIAEVDTLLRTKAAEVENAIRDGDLDALKIARQTEAELKDEDKVLHRLSADLANELRTALGREVIEAKGQYRKKLESALQQGRQALTLIDGCKAVAAELINARVQAHAVGEMLLLEPDSIQALAMAIYPDGDERKQLMIDLGMIDSRRAKKAGQYA